MWQEYLWGSTPYSLTMQYRRILKIITIMTKTEKANEKRLNNAVINNSCTKQAQLKALSNDLKKSLESKDKDGNVTVYDVPKYQQIAKYGLLPKVLSQWFLISQKNE